MGLNIDIATMLLRRSYWSRVSDRKCGKSVGVADTAKF